MVLKRMLDLKTKSSLLQFPIFSGGKCRVGSGRSGDDVSSEEEKNEFFLPLGFGFTLKFCISTSLLPFMKF